MKRVTAFFIGFFCFTAGALPAGVLLEKTSVLTCREALALLNLEPVQVENPVVPLKKSDYESARDYPFERHHNFVRHMLDIRDTNTYHQAAAAVARSHKDDDVRVKGPDGTDFKFSTYQGRPVVLIAKNRDLIMLANYDYGAVEGSYGDSYKKDPRYTDELFLRMTGLQKSREGISFRTFVGLPVEGIGRFRPATLTDHFQRHGNERRFRFASELDYEEAALRLFRSSHPLQMVVVGVPLEGRLDRNPRISKFDVRTGEFAAAIRNRLTGKFEIVTYYGEKAAHGFFAEYFSSDRNFVEP